MPPFDSHRPHLGSLQGKLAVSQERCGITILCPRDGCYMLYQLDLNAHGIGKHIKHMIKVVLKKSNDKFMIAMQFW